MQSSYLNLKGIKMHITLNIGLEISKNYLPEGVAEMQLAYEYVKEYLDKVFGKPLQIGLAQSATEKTVVVQYSNVTDVVQKLFWLAYVLKQDCIAYAVTEDATVIGGALVGEYAHEWNYGVFNSTYFIQPMFKLH